MSIFKNNFVVGITSAIAATILLPMIAPALKRSGRPLAKSLIKGGIVLYEKGREAVSGAGEAMEDLIAEVRTENAEKEALREDYNYPVGEHRNHQTKTNGGNRANGVSKPEPATTVQGVIQ